MPRDFIKNLQRLNSILANSNEKLIIKINQEYISISQELNNIINISTQEFNADVSLLSKSNLGFLRWSRNILAHNKEAIVDKGTVQLGDRFYQSDELPLSYIRYFCENVIERSSNRQKQTLKQSMQREKFKL